ncbi:unnamed protein product [Brachionus calyciflorus]|uniref:alanine--tRNA ligase n=1 Tax=Brachionus calyciflorus TaxID=104777 RepID=A0A813SZN6_9BILA|nr:unnamed protein product [Brachionus calyciflorus]
MLHQKLKSSLIKSYHHLKSNTFVPKRFYVSINNFEWPSEKVRQTFLDYFCKENDHKFIKSSSVLPKKGSGTYFTNAGMNQFKSIILGEVEPGDIIDTEKFIGVANSQKCIRIGGKHNDLEDIGKDTYHHTFFEMLGNWSFGSYDNEKACQMALELLVNKYKLNINGLYFTYFAGDKNLGLEPDFKSKNIWLKLGIPERQVLPFDMKANFWEMDVVGPCGPCTEIHYDRMVNNIIRSEQFTEARNLVNAGNERVIELWNLVFMNYNRIGSNNFSPLPFQVVDTGMGLERLTTVLNKLEDNYETDLFQAIFEYIFSRSNKVPKYSELSKNDPIGCSYRTLGDYMRSISISISDGLVPSRNGLGGFLKFLILKSMKISKENFGILNEADFLCGMIPVIVNTLNKAYPDLHNRTEYIQSVIRETDQRQKVKLSTSIQVTERFFKKLNQPNKLSGEQIWKLFKGDGSGDEISIDFIQQYCQSKNVEMDMQGFEKILLADNEKSLRNMKNSRNDNSLFIDLLKRLQNVPKTDNSFRYEFELDNYKREAIFKHCKLESRILALAVKNNDGKYNLTDEIKPNEDCIIILDKTNFYPESGGQQSDLGHLVSTSNPNNFTSINNVIHLKGYTFHIGKSNTSFKINDLVHCEIDSKQRYQTTLNHTAVHLLSHSIRKVYNSENSILQTSSLVKPDSFKFEFKFNQNLPKPKMEDIEKLEKNLNELISKSIPVHVKENVELENKNFNFPIRKLNDVLYPRKLRVVGIGANLEPNDESTNQEEHSAELCCGSHAGRTSDLKKLYITGFNIVGDSSYEIEGCTSEKADEVEKNNKQVLDLLNEMTELHNFKIENETKMTNAELYSNLNQIADKSIQIEAIFKKCQTSYSTIQKVKNESVKYRPSKNILQNIIKKYFIDELGEGSRQSLDSILIASIDPSKKLNFKFIAIDSILHHDQILSVISKISNELHPYLIIYNKYRNVYIFYSRSSFKKNIEVENFFNGEQEKILSKNSDAKLIEQSDNYRVIKCNLIKTNKFKYFSF